MGLFVSLLVDPEACTAPVECARCISICPVDVFRLEGRSLVTDPENEDECTLCELCLEACPLAALELVKHYDRRA